MRPFNVTVFEFTETDLSDYSIFNLRQPDKALLRTLDDGYTLNRNTELLISKREKAGLDNPECIYEIADDSASSRRFMPGNLQEGTLVHGNKEDILKLFDQVIEHLCNSPYAQQSLSRIDFFVGVWENHLGTKAELLFTSSVKEQACAAVYGDELGLTVYRELPNTNKWRSKMKYAEVKNT